MNNAVPDVTLADRGGSAAPMQTQGTVMASGRGRRRAAWRLTGALMAIVAFTLAPEMAHASEVPSLFGGSPELSAGRAGERVEGEWIDVSNQAPRVRTMARVDFGRLSELRDTIEWGLPARLRLDLFADVSPVARLQRATRTERGYAMSGRIEGQPNSAVTLVAHGDIFYGTVWTHDGVYEIRTAGAAQVVERLPPSNHVCGTSPKGPTRRKLADQPHEPSLATDSAGSGLRPDTDATAHDGTEVDVLVFYTAAARRQVGGHRNMLARIDHHVAWTNAAFELSATKMRVRLVGAQELVGHSEVSGLRAELLGLFERDSRVLMLRDALVADLALLHADIGGGLTGLGHPFSIARVDPLVFAHELGHGMGLHHDRAAHAQRTNDPFPYSYGYLFEIPSREAVFGCTIMCRNGAGVARTSSLPRFSNARQRYEGVPLGVPGDEPSDSVDGPADAARSLDEWMHVVTGFRRRASGCDFRLSPPARRVPAEGGEFELRVETSSGCAWQAESADGFSEVLAGSKGVGSGVVAYAVPANGGFEREVALAVAGRMHLAPQTGAREAKPVCERSAHVRDALVARTGKACGDIGIGDLLRLARLELDHPSGPVQGDFDGLANLGKLDLSLGPGATVAPGAFEGLENLQDFVLRVQDPFVATPGVFEGLANVTRFEWEGTRFFDDETMPQMPTPPGVFRGLSSVRLLHLSRWNASDIEPGTFEGLGKLTQLLIVARVLGPLRAGAFRGLPNVRHILLRNFEPIVVAAGVLDDVPTLEHLVFFGRDGIEFEQGAFRALSELRTLRISDGTPILAPGMFEGLSSLEQLRLNESELQKLPPGLFAGLSELHTLDLSDNELARLPREMLAGVPRLWNRLILSNNQLEALPTGIFDGLGGDGPPYRHIFQLALDGNRLKALPPGIFVGKKISRVTLRDNPGDPFDLALQPKRTSHAWHRPVTASVHLMEGTPLDIDFDLSASGLEWHSRPSALPAGAQWSEPFDLRPIGQTPVSVSVAGLPDIGGAPDCTDASPGYCYPGIRLVAGAPLTLNAVPDRKMEAEGTPWRIDLADVFLEFDSPPRSYQLASSAPSAATASVANDILTVTAHDAGASTITVTATMADGRNAARAFTVTVTEDARRFLRGWRLGLLEEERE